MANAGGDSSSCNSPRSRERKEAQNIETWKMSHYAWQTFNELRNNELFFDVVIVTDDKSVFPAHKLVLCACGQYFRSLFSGRWDCSAKSEVKIPGVSSSVMKKVMDFAYRRELIISSLVDAKELFIVSSQLGLDDIIAKCASYIENILDSSNCLEIWDFAKTYFCKILEESSFRYILNHFTEVLKSSKSSSKVKFTKLDVEDLKTILGSDELFVDSEKIVFQAVIKWIRHNLKERKCETFDLLAMVRFGLICPDYLNFKVRKNDLVQDCLRSKKLIDLHIELSETPSFSQNRIKPSYLKRSISDKTMTVLRQTLRPRYPRKLVLVVGGWSGESPTDFTETYEPLTEKWFNMAATLPPLLNRPRAYHGVAYTNDCMYIIGGLDGQVTYRSCDRFHLATWKWKAMSGMHQRRCYVAVAMLRGLIYAIGGSSGDNNRLRLRSSEVFDPKINVWTVLPDMAERRSDAGACAFNDKIYVAGGFTGHECVFSAEFFDPDLNQWTNMTPMRIPRSGVSVLPYKGCILAMGGFDGNTSRLNSVEAFDPDTNTWTFLPRMLIGRSNFGAAVIDEKLIVIGGFDGTSTCSRVECYEEIITQDRGFESDDSNSSASDNNSTDEAIVSRRRRDNNMDNGRGGVIRRRPQHTTPGASGDEFLLQPTGSQEIQLYSLNNIRRQSRMNANKTDQWTGVWRHLPNMEVPRSALSCCVISDLSPSFLRSIISSKHDEDNFL